MQQVVLTVLLDDGARDLARVLVGLIAIVVMALVVALITPLAILAGADFSAHRPPDPPTASTSTSASRHVAADDTWPADTSPGKGGASSVEVARRYLGVPYVFGGSNPRTGLDCSGLVQLVYRQLGFNLPRTAQLQYAATTRVAREQLQPGDLVFFQHTYPDPHDWITHVGIYIGDGMQINAPAEGHVVSIQPVFSGFWGTHFTSGGRVLGAG